MTDGIASQIPGWNQENIAIILNRKLSAGFGTERFVPTCGLYLRREGEAMKKLGNALLPLWPFFEMKHQESPVIPTTILASK